MSPRGSSATAARSRSAAPAAAVDPDPIAQLSSRLATRRQEANVEVAQRCVGSPALLEPIAARLADRDARLVGDCAEVMTKVAEQVPALVAPHAATLLGLLGHKNGRVRWESAHALALVAALVPRLLAEHLPALGRIALRDDSVIVRDYVLDAIAGYAATSAKAATAALPLLLEGATAWHAKHAARILRGLEPVAAVAPAHVPALRALAARFEQDVRPGVKKAARALGKQLGA